jgi:hypothetical protein
LGKVGAINVKPNPGGLVLPQYILDFIEENKSDVRSAAIAAAFSSV